MIAIVVGLNTLLNCTPQLNTNRYATDKDKKVVWNNCYQCHAPSDSLKGMPLDEMYDKFGESKLKEFTRNEFNIKFKCNISHHCSIKLTKSEVEAVVIYLREID